ncbi:hypothetical protein CVT25_008014 [Psilocybe cyanescens]|uniref:Uncharacterized protein n=1 Tax=Psilocybe cyanescens TaxID=93625 RepID=A0A409XMS9_PSICY|nr:hypothetical protein CVT25_008014 [Psilocybe cyanescens]
MAVKHPTDYGKFIRLSSQKVPQEWSIGYTTGWGCSRYKSLYFAKIIQYILLNSSASPTCPNKLTNNSSAMPTKPVLNGPCKRKALLDDNGQPVTLEKKKILVLRALKKQKAAPTISAPTMSAPTPSASTNSVTGKTASEKGVYLSAKPVPRQLLSTAGTDQCK